MNAHSQVNYVVVNGHLSPADKACVSLHDRGFRYGDGVFETLAVRGGVPCWFSWHMRRLEAGLAAVRIKFDVGALQADCRTLLHKNKPADGLLRIQITRGVGGRGYLPDLNAGPTVVIETMPSPPRPALPVALWQGGMIKIPPRALPMRYKLCQGMSSTLARLEAADNACFDALLVNEKGYLCETGSANLFWLKGGRLYTPPLDCGVLEGAARAAVLRLSPYPVEEVESAVKALAGAEAVFITNVVWGALAVGSLLPLGMKWDSVSAAERFCRLIADDRLDDCRRHGHEWESTGVTA
ncbi:MAG: aminotransferase class IV [Pseudomonadota bacterium]|nr:aminotransferase class IV [Pseudomonadota bacterium]MDE3038329.1 aminotransferase class IV [Pseudomonadota bacterium]